MKALSFYFFIRFFDLYCPRCIVALQKILIFLAKLLVISLQACYNAIAKMDLGLSVCNIMPIMYSAAF